MQIYEKINCKRSWLVVCIGGKAWLNPLLFSDGFCERVHSHAVGAVDYHLPFEGIVDKLKVSIGLIGLVVYFQFIDATGNFIYSCFFNGTPNI